MGLQDCVHRSLFVVGLLCLVDGCFQVIGTSPCSVAILFSGFGNRGGEFGLAVSHALCHNSDVVDEQVGGTARTRVLGRPVANLYLALCLLGQGEGYLVQRPLF